MADLQILDVSKSFDSLEVLKGVNLDVQAGEFVVFVGPSGCGKSTLLRMISGLEGISSGTMRLGGKVINNVDPAKRGIAMVFQSYALYPHMTVFQNMAFSLTMARAPRKEIRERVEKAADILQLRELLDRKPGQLSGGQKQRVAIGRTIVREPELFLFDEPLSNLDAELRVQMRAEIIELHRKLGSTMIFVTHDQIEAMTLADKMVVMNEGVIQQWGAPLEIYDDPDNKFVASFIGTPRMNFMPAHVAEVHDDHIVAVRASDPDPAPLAVPFKGFDPDLRQVELGIRPEHVRVAEKVDSSSCVPIDVRLVEELGDITYVHATLPGGSRLTAQSYGQRHTGAHQVHAVLDTDQMLVFDLEGNRLRSADRLRT